MRNRESIFGMVTIVVSIACASQAQSSPRVLVAGTDNTACIRPPVADGFAVAGFDVTQVMSISDIDSLDLSQFDVVYIPNGISVNNTGCGGENPIPSSIGRAKLVSFVKNGGGLYLPGESGQENQLDFLLWRDEFVVDALGGGSSFVGTCDCQLGTTVYLDPASVVNNFPDQLTTFGTQTMFTGGFDGVGNGTPIGYGDPDFTERPIVVAFDRGDLTLAPLGRLIVVNNTNNDAGFAAWAINAVSFLAGLSEQCAADLNDDGELDFFDVSAFLVAYQSQDPIADFTNDGAFDFFDVSVFLTAYLAGCP